MIKLNCLSTNERENKLNITSLWERDIMVYGYHRTSTTDQHLDRGIKSIVRAIEKLSARGEFDGVID